MPPPEAKTWPRPPTSPSPSPPPSPGPAPAPRSRSRATQPAPGPEPGAGAWPSVRGDGADRMTRAAPTNTSGTGGADPDKGRRRTPDDPQPPRHPAASAVPSPKRGTSPRATAGRARASPSGWRWPPLPTAVSASTSATSSGSTRLSRGKEVSPSWTGVSQPRNQETPMRTACGRQGPEGAGVPEGLRPGGRPRRRRTGLGSRRSPRAASSTSPPSRAQLKNMVRHLLHWVDEVRHPRKELLNLPEHKLGRSQELESAVQLIQALAVEWKPPGVPGHVSRAGPGADPGQGRETGGSRHDGAARGHRRRGPHGSPAGQHRPSTSRGRGRQASAKKSGDLASLSKTELYQRATEAGISGRSSMTREDLIKALTGRKRSTAA